MLQRLIVRAPYCQHPLILFRGQNSDIPWKEKSIGDQIISNTILSTTLDPFQAATFTTKPPGMLHLENDGKANCCLFVYHLTRNIPRLFMNSAELEYLLPAGLVMKLMNKDQIPIDSPIGLLDFFHIQVSEVAFRTL